MTIRASFTHCAASGRYRSGILVVLADNANSNWSLGFSSDNFHWTKGAGLTFDFLFDGQASIHLSGAAIDTDFAAAPLSSTALAAFRKSRLMEVDIAGTKIELALTLTGRLAATVENCVAKVKANGLANAGDFSLPAANSVVQSTASSNPKPSDSNSTTKTTQQDGTGFIVSASGQILTNYHVIDGCVGEISGNLSGQGTMALRVVASDETNDLALLQANQPVNGVASIRATPIHPGDSIIVIGYPLHGLLTSDFTVTSGIVSSLSGLLNDTRYLQISAGVQSGNSGGPLLDTSGKLAWFRQRLTS
jgi:S1-C subfamily serine protease